MSNTATAVPKPTGFQDSLKTALTAGDSPRREIARKAPSMGRTEAARAVVAELTALLTELGSMPFPARPVMDEDDRELYHEACAGIGDAAQMRQVRREIRRTCEFRPIPAKVAAIVKAITTPPETAADREAARLAALPPALASTYRIRSREEDTPPRPGQKLLEGGPIRTQEEVNADGMARIQAIIEARGGPGPGYVTPKEISDPEEIARRRKKAEVIQAQIRASMAAATTTTTATTTDENAMKGEG